MPTFDLATLGGVLANLGVSILSYAGIAVILYNIGKILIRTVSWALDTMMISMISKFYGYFEQILSGTIFTDSVVKGMMNRVYLIIGVILLFRLGMLLVQYMINPSQVMEEKGGVNSLVKRAIIGLCLIIFIPTIFDIANDLQAAILKDQVIERVIMDKDDLAKLEEQKKEYGTGRVIAMTIYQGFWNINKDQVADKKIVRAYEEAEKKKDPSLIEDAGYGILTESGGKYAFDYFPILSTVVLAYVLYLVVKYCIDMVVRLFKLLVLQIISPITIVEYIVNGDRNEVFQKWKKSVVANYAMLFVRVFTIWFVAFVALLMNGPKDGTLLTTQDYLLKAIIVLGLLAFMMDFPKMMSDIFGLDLEQDASVKGVLGKAIGVGVAGLAVGGAAVKGIGKPALSMAHASSQSLKAGIGKFATDKGHKGFATGLTNPKGLIGSAMAGSRLGKAVGNKASALGKAVNGNKAIQNVKELASDIKDASKGTEFQKAANDLKTGALVAGAVLLNSNKAAQSVKGGYDKVEEEYKKQKNKAEGDAIKAEERVWRRQQMAASTTIIDQQASANFQLNNIADNTKETVTRTVNIDNKLGKVSGSVGSIANSVGDIAKNAETTATRTVNIDNKLGKVSSDIGDISSTVSDIGKNAEVTATRTVNVDQKLGKISSDIGNISDNTEITADVALNTEPLIGSMDDSLKKIDANTEMSAVVDLDVEPTIKEMGQDVKKMAKSKNKKDNDTDELL